MSEIKKNDRTTVNKALLALALIPLCTFSFCFGIFNGLSYLEKHTTKPTMEWYQAASKACHAECYSKYEVRDDRP